MRLSPLLVAVLLGGCAKRMYEAAPPPPPPPPGDYGYADDYAPMEEMERSVASTGSPSSKMASGKAGGAPSAPSAPPPPPRPSPAPAPGAPPEPEPVEEPEAAEEAQAQRMIHYEGWARLRATEPEETVDAIAKMAKDLGGRVEHLAGGTVSVRVPVAAFDQVYADILKLGDVLDRSVRADDVTDQFLAIDLRVRTLKETRDRLVALLAKAQDEQEKLALLQEITRVTEELDSVESMLRTLADLAAMSRITVEVVPREAFSGNGGPSVVGFEWIASISPFDRGVWDDKRLALDVPQGLVSLSEKGPFKAESADGTVLWTQRLPNDPVGTGPFWTAALVDRVGEEFAKVEQRSLGAWSCVDLDQPGEEAPYRWQVCVATEGKWLWLAQAYYANPDQVKRYGAQVDAAITKVGGGA